MVALSVLLGFLLLLIIDFFVLRAEKKMHPAFVKNYEVVDSVSFNNLSVRVPADLFISRGHTWAEPDRNGLIKIGVDEFITKSLGEIKVTNTAQNGILINEGDPVIEARLGGKKIVFRSPVSGRIVSKNHDLPGKIITDPFGEDWGVIIKPENFQSGTGKLKTNEEVIDWMKNEMRRFKSFLEERLATPGLAGVTMYDGGHLVSGAVSHLDGQSVELYEKEFLSI